MLGQMHRGRQARRLVIESRRQAALELCAAIAAEPVGQRHRLAAFGARQHQRRAATPAKPGFARIRGATSRTVHGTPEKLERRVKTYTAKHTGSSTNCEHGRAGARARVAAPGLLTWARTI